MSTHSSPSIRPAPQLVVIGASAAGVTALRQLAADLPADFGATVLAVQHIGVHEKHPGRADRARMHPPGHARAARATRWYHTGRAYSLRSLDVAVAEETDGALRNALHALHERATVLEQMAETSRLVGAHCEAARQAAAAGRVTGQSRLLRELLERSPDAGE